MASLLGYNVTWLLPFSPDLYLSLWRLYWDIMLHGYYHLAKTSICLYDVFIGYNATWLLPFSPDLYLSLWRLYWNIMLHGYYHLAKTSICLYSGFIGIKCYMVITIWPRPPSVSMASLLVHNVTWLLPFGPDLHLSLWRLYWI